MIQEVLDTGVLDPTAAQRLSGKLGFLTQAVFGAVGRAAIQPIHKRASDGDQPHAETGRRSHGIGSPARAHLAQVRPVFRTQTGASHHLCRRLLRRPGPSRQGRTCAGRSRQTPAATPSQWMGLRGADWRP